MGTYKKKLIRQSTWWSQKLAYGSERVKHINNFILHNQINFNSSDLKKFHFKQKDRNKDDNNKDDHNKDDHNKDDHNKDVDDEYRNEILLFRILIYI